MKDKDWLGADLIFDLDCDHLEGADKMTLDEMLAHVKTHTIRLLDFCLNEFGFRQDQIEIVFSGGRGYHIHVDDDRMALLDAACRREIAIYVSNKDLEAGGPSYMADVKKMGLSSGSSTSVTRIPHHQAAGWKGRYTRGILAGLEAGGSAFDLPGVGPKKRAALEAIRLNPRSLQDIREGNLARFSTPEVQAILALGQAQAMQQRADVDAPVTSDIKRLIRLPGSLHGKTGLTTTIVTLDHLAAFDPLREACHLQDLGGEYDMVGIKAGSR